MAVLRNSIIIRLDCCSKGKIGLKADIAKQQKAPLHKRTTGLNQKKNV